MKRIALGIEYNGASYYGWQRQFTVPSVQEHIEIVCSKIADQPITVFCAGRTDRGVHATGQIVHFDYDHNANPRPLIAWVHGCNSLLPNDISITWAKEVSSDFHARFSAVSRRYQYYIYCASHKRALLNNRALWVRKNIDITKMQSACKYLLGEQDFTSLRSTQCEALSPVRTIISADIININNFIVLDIKANAFLQHMVRNIIGCLLEIGFNNQPVEWLYHLIQAKDRSKAALAAAPDGLYLVAVEYKPQFALNPPVIMPFNG